MRTMFAVTLQPFDQGDLVVLVVAIRILQTIQPAMTRLGGVIAFVVDHHVKTIERIQQAMRVPDPSIILRRVPRKLEDNGIYFDLLLIRIGSHRGNGQPV